MLAVILGASGAIGRSTVAKLLVRDYVVIAFVKDKIGEFSLLDYLAKSNVRVNLLYIFNADFRQEDEISAIINKTEKLAKKFKGISLFVNCAGIYIKPSVNPRQDLNRIINFEVPLKLFFSLTKNMNKDSRAIFIMPDFLRHNSFLQTLSKTHKNYLNSKLILMFNLLLWLKSGQNENVYFFIPKKTNSQFFVKNVTGLKRILGQIRNIFSFPPEFSAEQIITVATRKEFDGESGGIYYNLKPVPAPKFIQNKKFAEKFNNLLLKIE